VLQSKRQRNQANYTEDDVEAIDSDNQATNLSEAADVDDVAADENPGYADIDHIETVHVEDTERLKSTMHVEDTEAAPKEYLFTGGGFCGEEDNENMDPDTNEPIERVNEVHDVASGPYTDPKEDMINTTTSGATDQSAPLDANPVLPIGERASEWGLTAMPSLKRRKS
jgi:hypothetical protein